MKILKFPVAKYCIVAAFSY